MEYLAFLALAIGMLVIGNKTGIETGRRQVLDDVNSRILHGLRDHSEFAQKHGVRGTYLAIDYFGESKVGTGYNASPFVPFVVIHKADFDRMKADEERRDHEEL